MILFSFLHKEQSRIHARHIPTSIEQVKQSYKNLSKEAKMLIITNIFLSIGLGLGSTFLTIFLWRQIHDFSIIVVFYVVQYPIIFASFFFLGTMKYRFKLRTLIQIGAVFYILMFTLLIFFQGQLAHYLWLIGSMYGAGVGISSCGNTPFQYIFTQDENRDRFYSIGIAQGLIMSIAVPFISGIIISQTIVPLSIILNYYVLFSMAICLLAIGLVFAFLLPENLLTKIEPKDVLMPFSRPGWHFVTYAAFIDGFKGGLESFVGSILAFVILTKEVNMGAYNAFFAIAATVVALYLGKKLQREKRLLVGSIGALLILLERGVYIMFFSFFGLVISSFIGIFGEQFFTLGLISTFFDMIDHSPQHEKEYFAYITFKEIPFGIGRIAGILVFLIILHFMSDITSAKIWYLFLGILPFTLYFLTKKFERVIENNMTSYK